MAKKSDALLASEVQANARVLNDSIAEAVSAGLIIDVEILEFQTPPYDRASVEIKISRPIE